MSTQPKRVSAVCRVASNRKRRAGNSSPSDMPHLLDPAYSGILLPNQTANGLSGSPSSGGSYSPPKYSYSKMYVDEAGIEHDPDYRMFPVGRPPSQRRRSGGARWNRDQEEDIMSEDEDEDEGEPLARRRTINSVYPSTPAQQHRRASYQQQQYRSRTSTPEYMYSTRVIPVEVVEEKEWVQPTVRIGHQREERSVWEDSKEYIPSRFGKGRSVAREAGVDVNGEDDWS